MFRSSLVLSYILAAVLLGAISYPRQASASVLFTTTPNPFEQWVPESRLSTTIDWTLKNVGTQGFTVCDNTIINPCSNTTKGVDARFGGPFGDGLDALDAVTGVMVTNDGCSGVKLNPNGTCTFTIQVTIQDLNSSETVNDWGRWRISPIIALVGFQPTLGNSADVKVYDDGATTPQPSSLLLCGSGLVTLLGTLRRRVRGRNEYSGL